MTSVDDAVGAAVRSFPLVGAASRNERAGWLDAVAAALDAAASELVAVAIAETHLPEVRLSGEVARTTGQLRSLADAVREGAYLEAIIDHAVPSAVPPRPDLRRILVPLGPVAVYSASNFPFAFSVLGGDTAAALAVGCPVVVKAHPGHPELSRRVATVAAEALITAGAPEGIFGLVEGFTAGVELVQHPDITAAAFTGSVHGGRALFDLAAAREIPIPFYGELGSVNPVVVTPAAVRERGVALAAGLVGSVTLGVGQFCTKPGIVFAPTGFEKLVVAELGEATGGVMLTEPMSEHHVAAIDEAAALVGVRRWAAPDRGVATPTVLATDVNTLLGHQDELLAEHFGPSTVVVGYADEAELDRALNALPGGLTATVHGEPDDDLTAVVAALSRVSGRVLFEGWPTGVAVTWAQHHGGPYPAATSLFSSVGATSLRRFLRPIAYQSAPERMLPVELRDADAGIARRIDGVLTLPSVR